MESAIEQKKIIQKENKKYSKVLFNTGNCCKDSDEISGIEITEGKIKEIYWKRGANKPDINSELDLNIVFGLI